MRALSLLGVALAVVVSPLGRADGQAVSAPTWSEGVRTDPDGITVVIDFQELGGGVNVRCAPGPVESGLDALDGAGIAWEGTVRFPGFVCRIAGLPAVADEPCFNTPPASAFWSYWMAPRGGSWCYGSRGAGTRTPPPGTIEGWSFALDRAAASIPPPRFAPPPALPGVDPEPIDPGDCPVPVDPTTTTTAPTTTAAPTTAVPSTTAPPTTTRPTVPTTTTQPPTTVPTTVEPTTARRSRAPWPGVHRRRPAPRRAPRRAR